MNVAVSKFREKPKLKDTWRVMVLGLLPLVSCLLLLAFYVFAGPVAEAVMMKFGIYIILFLLISPAVALVYGVIVYIQGERSWVLWIGFIPAILVTVVCIVAFIVSAAKDIARLF